MICFQESKLAGMTDPWEAREQQIVQSWNANAEPWAQAIQAGSIASRKLVTDAAIVNAVMSVQPQRVLDLGCGEGWLARSLAARGVTVIGVDAVPHLIAKATQFGHGEFHVQEYRAIAERRWHCDPVDAVVCNFSLLGGESVESMMGAVGGCLGASGHLIVQTLHPLAACGEHPYQDGWREGSWRGFGADFSDPAPWYFRTLESWLAMLRRNGFEVLECREPTAPGAFTPASLILMCRPR